MSSNETLLTPEYIIGRYFIRYEKMNNLLHYAFDGLEVNRVNIYIDLYSIYHSLFSRSYATTIAGYVTFTSHLINLCIHYRTYFRHLGIDTKIFLVSSYNIPKDSITVIPEYNHVMRDKLNNQIMSEMIGLNTGLLELICPYLPDIHFLKTEYESSVLMNTLIDRELSIEPTDTKGRPIQSIILSTDLYPTQLAVLKPNVSYIYPIKSYKGDNTLIISQNASSHALFDFWPVILRKYQNSSSYRSMGSLSPSNFMLLAALNRFPDRCLPLIYNITTSSKLISQVPGFDSMKLTPESLFDFIPVETLKVNPEVIINRYRVLDIQYQSILYSNSVESKTVHYENLSDNSAINLINDKYFKDNPIDIFRL